jgi:hypothetical protein
VLGVAILVVVGISAVQAETSPSLPSVPTSQLIASTLSAIADRAPVSGTVATHVDLGLPQIPSNLGSSAGPAGVLLGDQTFKVWSSPDGVRIAQILPFGERDLVASPAGAWYWDSSRFTAWHVAVPAGKTPTQPPSLGDFETVVGRALQAIAPYATVAQGNPTVVAGRDAYLVTLTPESRDTLVGHVDLAIDAQTRMPLRFEVFAKGHTEPSVEAGFTSVSFGQVDKSIFEFTPPSGATVKQAQLPSAHKGGESAGAVPEVRTFGTGFGMIVAVRLPEVPKDLRLLFPYSGPLGSAALVVRSDHVWLVAGAVPADALAGVETKLP